MLSPTTRIRYKPLAQLCPATTNVCGCRAEDTGISRLMTSLYPGRVELLPNPRNEVVCGWYPGVQPWRYEPIQIVHCGEGGPGRRGEVAGRMRVLMDPPSRQAMARKVKDDGSNVKKGN